MKAIRERLLPGALHWGDFSSSKNRKSSGQFPLFFSPQPQLIKDLRVTIVPFTALPPFQGKHSQFLQLFLTRQASLPSLPSLDTFQFVSAALKGLWAQGHCHQPLLVSALQAQPFPLIGAGTVQPKGASLCILVSLGDQALDCFDGSLAWPEMLVCVVNLHLLGEKLSKVMKNSS